MRRMTVALSKGNRANILINKPHAKFIVWITGIRT